jgi:hypothetical protein
LRTTHPAPGVLKLSQSRTEAATSAIATIAFLSVWYFFLLEDWESSSAPLFVKVIFLCAPLVTLPDVYRSIRTVLSGESFVLSRNTGTIQRNGELLARFSAVSRVQIRKINDETRACRVSLVLRNGDKIMIDTTRREQAISLGEDLAEVLDVPLNWK